MALLIDCYNVLHEPMPPRLAGLDEAGLCRALARALRTGALAGLLPGRGAASARIVVVRDGQAKPLGVTESPVPEVELVFAGRQRSADQVIVEMIESDTAPRRLAVVSSDHQIQQAARRRRARVLSSAEFVRLLASAPAGPRAAAGRPELAGPLDEAEVRRWLKRFGVTEDEDK